VSTENVEQITPAQVRGARALLEMTQPELAKKAGLGLSTVVDFEKSRRRISTDATDALRKALEHAGIVFISESGGGIGVLFSKAKRSAPTR
jgi:DNA-binding transcriptional regulator YiaG